MEEQRGAGGESAAAEDFADLLARSPAGPARLEPGARIEATILQIGAEWVFLDVGQKGEGVLDVKELLDAEGRLTAAKGDRLQAYFLGRDESELRFTTRLGAGATGSVQLEQAWSGGIPVEGRLEEEIKGGYAVRLPGGVRAFCPFSQLGRRRPENPGELLGQTLPFRITQFGRQGRTIVLSHRALLEEEQRRRREALKRTLKEGMTVRGTVTSVRDFGAFIDIGGIEGLLPVSEAGWGITGEPSGLFQVGQVLEVSLKSCDWEKNRFTLSLRATLADPWDKVGTVYALGATHTGVVARLTPFGAFVTLEAGVDGLLHISKIGAGRRLNHPRELLQPGQRLAVTIEEIDPERRRIALGLAAPEGEAAEATAFLKRPAAALGTFGDLLQAGLERKKKGVR